MTEYFSTNENKLLKIIKVKKRIMISDLVEEFYKGEKTPILPNNKINSLVFNINKKCKYYNLKFFINGEGLGRGGKTVWIEKK
jgi:hypothetical protein